MDILNHGGFCCGIKHIQGFGTYSTKEGTREDFIKKTLQAVIDKYRPLQNPNAYAPIGCPCVACRRETERQAQVRGLTLEQYTQQLRDNRALTVASQNEAIEQQRKTWSTAVECVLNSEQIGVWRTPLENCGFKEVFQFKNSNSGRMCYIFYGLTNPVEVKNVEPVTTDATVPA